MVKKATKGKTEDTNPPVQVELPKDNPDEDQEANSNDEEDSLGSSDNEAEGPADEYEDYDSSDEEDIRNTIGNIPKNWYDDYRHFGYDWDGNAIPKSGPDDGDGDRLDSFLKRMEDPDFWRTVKDPQTGQEVVLKDEDIELIKRIHAGRIPDVEFDEYAPWIEWFTNEVMQTPIRKFPEHKRSFLPSKHEQRKIAKLVHALKMGWIKSRADTARSKATETPQFYMLWQTDNEAEEMRRLHNPITAPKRHLPGHAESYNPPPEFLFDARELRDWKRQQDTPWKRKLSFVPRKYAALRQVPAFRHFIRERFLRCLDLYLCPRAIQMKYNIQPDDLLPKLPHPNDLQPFPNTLSLEYNGHIDIVRSLSYDPIGQYLLSGSDDGTARVWEINTGRCVKKFAYEEGQTIRSVAWCPNRSLSLILVAADEKIYIINPYCGDLHVAHKTDTVLMDSNIVTSAENWTQCGPHEYHRFIIEHCDKTMRKDVVAQVVWHGRGDYFASVAPDAINRAVLIHQLSTRRTQVPFRKSRGQVQSVVFHPQKAIIFVATQSHVRVYDLVKQQMVKKLLTGVKWLSSMSIHSGGDNLLLGSYDNKILWFDLDLSTKPYQNLRLHNCAVRTVAYHLRYPLFASGADDGTAIVSHGMVYNDLMKNPLIVPLKRLGHHRIVNDVGVVVVVFHPFQPWLFTAGADGTIKLFTN